MPLIAVAVAAVAITVAVARSSMYFLSPVLFASLLAVIERNFLRGGAVYYFCRIRAMGIFFAYLLLRKKHALPASLKLLEAASIETEELNVPILFCGGREEREVGRPLTT